MDTGETELRSMFPNASDDQIEEMQSAVVNLTQKRIRGANEEELQNDPLFPWLMGQLVGSVGVEDLAPGSIGGSLGARVASGDRKSVVSGTSVYVRVDLGGRRIIKKKTKKL